MLLDSDVDNGNLGQFIPLHYHHNMLMDEQRMACFEAAIDRVVFPGARVVDLGGGTGVLSWFAARRASKVWCVELDSVLVGEARALLGMNEHHARIEVVHADAFEFLPPEPVDLVICEMVHVAMLRERLVEVIESFKRRYLARFGDPLPRFMPEAALMAVQPVQQNYRFRGFHAPIIQFQRADASQPGTHELAVPAIYSTLDFSEPNDLVVRWEGEFVATGQGTVNALRFVTKNILAVLSGQDQRNSPSAIEWLNHYLVLPLREPCAVKEGDGLQVAFNYTMGGTIASLRHSLSVAKK